MKHAIYHQLKTLVRLSGDRSMDPKVCSCSSNPVATFMMQALPIRDGRKGGSRISAMRYTHTFLLGPWEWYLLFACRHALHGRFLLMTTLALQLAHY